MTKSAGGQEESTPEPEPYIMPEDETPKKKPETLDLIDEKKKPSRRARQREVASKVKTVDDHKAEALDLGVEDEEAAKKKARKTRKTEQSGKSQLPSISKKLDQLPGAFPFGSLMLL